MKFNTTKIRGTGRGMATGFPAINMVVPENVPILLLQGVYAARAIIRDQEYQGILTYGPSPTFGDDVIRLSIHLFDTAGFSMEDGEEIEVEAVKFVRGIEAFGLPELLVLQMEKDMQKVREILKGG